VLCVAFHILPRRKSSLYSLCGLTDSLRTNISRPFLGDTSISPRYATVTRCNTASVLQSTCRHNIVTLLIERIRLPSDARVYCDLVYGWTLLSSSNFFQNAYKSGIMNGLLLCQQKKLRLFDKNWHTLWRSLQNYFCSKRTFYVELHLFSR
jgi:hypothetical protein